jgi:hypothetical protein
VIEPGAALAHLLPTWIGKLSDRLIDTGEPPAVVGVVPTWAIRDDQILWLPSKERVQFDPIRKRVDHRPGRSKDCADAVAGALFAAITDTEARS